MDYERIVHGFCMDYVWLMHGAWITMDYARITMDYAWIAMDYMDYVCIWWLG